MNPTTPHRSVPDDHAGNVAELLNLLVGRVEPRGVVHVGAHAGQEVDMYRAHGFRRIALIEANPNLATELEARFGGSADLSVHACAIADHVGTVKLLIHTSRSGSVEPASILPLKKFKEIVPTLHTDGVVEVPAITLDAFFDHFCLAMSDFNVLNIDIQGAEHLAFRGARRYLDQVEAVITEVNLIEMYDGGATEAQIVAILGEHDLRPVGGIDHELFDETGRFPAWGERLFLRLPSDS